MDGAGNVYIADIDNDTIKKWTAANNNVTRWFLGLSSPTGVAVDGAGNVYFADKATSDQEVDGGQQHRHHAGLLGILEPLGVAVDGAGNVYIADDYHNAIKELPHAFVDPTARLEGLRLAAMCCRWCCPPPIICCPVRAHQ